MSPEKQVSAFLLSCQTALQNQSLVFFLSTPMSEGTVYSLNEREDICVRERVEAVS